MKNNTVTTKVKITDYDSKKTYTFVHLFKSLSQAIAYKNALKQSLGTSASVQCEHTL